MSDRKPFSAYHRECLSRLATDLQKARAEREAHMVLHRMLTAEDLRAAGLNDARCLRCLPPFEQRDGGARIDTCHLHPGCNCDPAEPCAVQHAQQPAPHIHIDRTWWQAHVIPLRRRLAARFKRICEAWIDPVIRN